MAEEHEWELTKENIQPLKQGRAMASLQAALIPQCRGSLEERRKAFEVELRTYTGDDPLHVWHTYILWLEQHYPKGGHEVNMQELLERCIKQYYGCKEYSADARFVDVFLRYALLVADTEDVFKVMQENNIGTTLAKFYVARANYHEGKGNTCKAAAVLDEGLRRGAGPASVLHDARSRLELSVGRQVMQQVREGEGNAREGMLPSSQECRTALGPLRPHGKKAAVGSTRVGRCKLATQGGVAAPGVPKVGENPKTFRIPDEENAHPCATGPGAVVPPPFVHDAERTKENVKEAGKWTEAKAPQKRSVVNPVPRFEVHEEDDVGVKTPAPSVVPGASAVLSSRKPTGFSGWVTQRALFEPPNPRVRVMYDKEKVYAGTTEFQFEEIRFAKMEAQRQEREREEREAARDRKIAELCAEVEKLRNLVKMMQSRKQDISIATEIEALKHSITFMEASIVAGDPRKAASRKQDSRVVEQVPIPAPELSEPSSGGEVAGGSQGGSGHTSDVSRVVRSLWDGSLVSWRAEEPAECAKAAAQVAGFEVYSDSTQPVSVPAKDPDEVGRKEDSGPASDPCSQGIPAQEQNDENRAPEGYTQCKSVRKLSGVLVPSEGIPTAPREPQEEEEEDKNEEELAGVQPFQEDDDNLTGYGRGSVSLGKVTSTPFPAEQKVPHDGEDFTVGPLKALNADGGGARGPAAGARDADAVPRANETANHFVRADLSVILECSKETSSKSGSSSSGSSSSSSLGSHATNCTVSRHHTAHLSAVEERVEESKSPESELEEDGRIRCPSGSVDPFDRTVRETILANLEVPIEDHSGFHYCGRNIPALKIGQPITLGKDEQYVVLKLLAQGAYAKVYLAVPDGSLEDDETTPLEGSAGKVVLKVTKGHPDLWEFHIISKLRSRLEFLSRPSVSKSVVPLHSGTFYKNGSVLVMPHYEYGTLLDVVNAFKQHGEGGIPESLALYFTLELIVVLAKMHKAQIIHGDVKPDNVLVRDFPNDEEESLESRLATETSCVCLVDFGRSIDMRCFEAGTTFDCVVTTDGFQCIEMREGRPWTYQTDWYGLLGCVHIMLFGEYMETEKGADGRWGIKCRFKRYWKRDLWSKIFDALLNIPSCLEMPNVVPFVMDIHSVLVESRQRQELLVRAQKARYYMS